MADAGLDLWSPAAVAALKNHSTERLCKAWRETLSSILIKDASDTNKDKETNGNAKSEEEDEEEKEGEEKQEEADEDQKTENEELGGDASLTPEQARDLHTQWLFDVSLLRRCLGSGKGVSSEQLDDLADTLLEKSGLDSHSRQRIVKSSQDFWQRTSLLFGLLV
jgi:ribosomal protein L12E/L44/L45/RPP1/RPP2